MGIEMCRGNLFVGIVYVCWGRLDRALRNFTSLLKNLDTFVGGLMRGRLLPLFVLGNAAASFGLIADGKLVWWGAYWETQRWCLLVVMMLSTSFSASRCACVEWHKKYRCSYHRIYNQIRWRQKSAVCTYAYAASYVQYVKEKRTTINKTTSI